MTEKSFITGEIRIKNEKIISISDDMRMLLEMEENSEYENYIGNSFYLLVPFADRKKFKAAIENAEEGEPSYISGSFFTANGEEIQTLSWIKKENDEFLLNCIIRDIDKESGAQYFKALMSAYNIIFKVDLRNDRVTCIHGRQNSPANDLYNITMSVDSAVNYWINHSIIEKDRPMMTDYFERITTKDYVRSINRPLQANCTVRLSGKEEVYAHYLVVTVAMDNEQELVCLRDTTNVKYSEDLFKENLRFRTLRDHYENVLSSGASGFACIKVSGDKIYLLSAEKVYRFFEPYLKRDMMIDNGGMPLDAFLKTLSIDAEQFRKCLNGEEMLKISLGGNNFTVDFQSVDSHDKEIYDLYFYREGISNGHKITIRTFGFFDVFVDGEAVMFKNAKEKELLALIVDRNGGIVTTEEAITYLFDGINDVRTKTKYRKVAMFLQRTLELYGISNIIRSAKGNRSLDTSLVECDYYEFLKGNPKYRELFGDAYMSGYDWANETLNMLFAMTSDRNKAVKTALFRFKILFDAGDRFFKIAQRIGIRYSDESFSRIAEGSSRNDDHMFFFQKIRCEFFRAHAVFSDIREDIESAFRFETRKSETLEFLEKIFSSLIIFISHPDDIFIAVLQIFDTGILTWSRCRHDDELMDLLHLIHDDFRSQNIT